MMGLYKQKNNGYLYSFTKDTENISQIRSDSVLCKKADWYAEISTQDKELEEMNEKQQKDKMKQIINHELLQRNLDIIHLNKQMPEGVSISTLQDHHPYFKWNKEQRNQLLHSIPKNSGQRILNERDNLINKLNTEYNVNLGINEAQVGKFDKCEQFTSRIKIISVLDNNTSKLNKDYFFETLSDQHNSIKNLHQSADDTEINLLKIDKIIDQPQQEELLLGVDQYSASSIQFNNFIFLSIILTFYLHINYPTKSILHLDQDQQDPFTQIFAIITIIQVFQKSLGLYLNIQLNITETKQTFEQLIIIITLIIGMIIDYKFHQIEVMYYGLLVQLSRMIKQEKQDQIENFGLKSMLYVLENLLSKSKKISSRVRLYSWVHEMQEKLESGDVQNNLLDYYLTGCNPDHIYLNPSYYLKFRDLTNIFHKRQIRTWNGYYPRPLSEQFFKKQNLRRSGQTDSENIMSGQGVPQHQNRWTKQKSSIIKKIHKVKQEELDLGIYAEDSAVSFGPNSDFSTDMKGLKDLLLARAAYFHEFNEKIKITDPLRYLNISHEENEGFPDESEESVAEGNDDKQSSDSEEFEGHSQNNITIPNDEKVQSKDTFNDTINNRESHGYRVTINNENLKDEVEVEKLN